MNEGIEKAEGYLRNITIPGFVDKLMALPITACKPDYQFAQHLHSNGINCCFLGVVRQRVMAYQLAEEREGEGGEDSKDGEKDKKRPKKEDADATLVVKKELWSRYLLLEMIARTCKNLIRMKMRHTLTRYPFLSLSLSLSLSQLFLGLNQLIGQ